jgi:hypothetical protein
MTKIDETTKEQRVKLAEQLSLTYMLEDTAKYADRRHELTAEYAALMGLTLIAASNFLWDVAEDRVVNSPYMFELAIAGLLNDEAEVYRSKIGRKMDQDALTAE